MPFAREHGLGRGHGGGMELLQRERGFLACLRLFFYRSSGVGSRLSSCLHGSGGSFLRFHFRNFLVGVADHDDAPVVNGLLLLRGSFLVVTLSPLLC